jgi:hypothetical protein
MARVRGYRESFQPVPPARARVEWDGWRAFACARGNGSVSPSHRHRAWATSTTSATWSANGCLRRVKGSIHVAQIVQAIDSPNPKPKEGTRLWASIARLKLSNDLKGIVRPMISRLHIPQTTGANWARACGMSRGTGTLRCVMA